MTGPEPTDGPAAEESRRPGMTLAEEDLVINTELVETGRARLVKRVEVETVTRTFELRREFLEIERLDPARSTEPDPSPTKGGPVVLESGPMAPGSMQGGSIEIVLMQEEALITTQLVPRERVRLTKQVVAENRTIDADLSSERVDLEQRPSSDGSTTD
jgi:stress response protein YsnF